MNWAASHLAGSGDTPSSYARWKAFYRKEDRTEKLSARKNEISLGESKSSGDNGFSLAEL